jgi:Secretion system C-terminal sorting domain
VCGTAIKFNGTSNIVPVHTPNCFSNGSSLSHFEDECIGAPNGNMVNNYFVMTDITAFGSAKRSLKIEEKNALCDLGYNINANYNYGFGTTFQNTTNLGAACNGIAVAGINDGINQITGAYTFSGIKDVGTTINNVALNMATILANDTNATSFEGLEDVFEPTTSFLSTTLGTTLTTINFHSSVGGVHLLRYVPINSLGQRGNITYVYLSIIDNSISCALPNACNLVSNGDFEQYSSLNLGLGTIDLACGWKTANNGTPDYFNTNSTTLYLKIPCNSFGYQICNSNLGNGYAGFGSSSPIASPKTSYSEHLYTKLDIPLVAGTKYQLSLDVSLAENYGAFGYEIQAYFSTTQLNQISNLSYILPANGVATNLIDNIIHINYNSWDKITFNYTATGGEQYLYIGGLQSQLFQSCAAPPINTTLCNYSNNIGFSSTLLQDRLGYYFIDNITLVNAAFDLPPTMLICNNSFLPNLVTYLSAGTPTNGIFIGQGVTYNSANGWYSFQPQTGMTNAAISYSYTNNLGCIINLADTIVFTTFITPTFATIPTLCQGSTPPVLPTTSTNSITGTWNPTTISTTTSGNYTFTPNAGQCANPISRAIQVISNTAFVTNADSFTVTLSSTVTTAVSTQSVCLNDTYNGEPLPTTIIGLYYTIVLTGTPPTIPVGGIAFNASIGIFTVQPNTTQGVYNYQYYLQNSCYNTPIKSIKIVVNRLTTTNRTTFIFCYSNTTSINSSTATPNQTLFNSATIGGQLVNGTNGTIVLVAPTLTLPTGITSINANGTVTISQTLPGQISFYYKICSGGVCSSTIICDIIIQPTVWGQNDVVTAAANGVVNYNVLSNDQYRGTCSSPGLIPATLSNVTITNVVNNPPYYSINPANGNIIATLPIISGSRLLTYRLCDNAYPTLCANYNVVITVPTLRNGNNNVNNSYEKNQNLFNLDETKISPNPTNEITTIKFNDTLTSSCKLELYDLLGRLLIEKDILKDILQYDLILSNYSTGQYFIKIIDVDNKKIFRKIIIKR